MRRQERLRQHRRRPLVDGRRAHLHGRRRPDLAADDRDRDTGERQLGHRAHPRPGEVDRRRAGAPRRRPGDRAVHEREVDLVGDPSHRRRRDRVQLDEQRPCARSLGGSRHVERDRLCLRGRRDREDDVRLAHHLGKVRRALEPAAPREPRRPLAAAVERRDDPRAALEQRAPDGAAHRTGADDADGRHVASVVPRPAIPGGLWLAITRRPNDSPWIAGRGTRAAAEQVRRAR